MKLKCNLCNEGPIVELPEPQYFDELILCPDCGRTLASVKKDSFENLVWKVWDKMKIDVDIPDGKSGEWKIDTFEMNEEDCLLYNSKNEGRELPPGMYKRLMCGCETVMTNTPNEINDHLEFINEAKQKGGHVLITGLGLGVCIKAILESEKITKISVIELSKDVIKLVAPTYMKDERVEVINCSAFDYEPPENIRYTCVWHDIWYDICADNLPQMNKLHRKYENKTDWQGSWVNDLCLEQTTSDVNYPFYGN